MLELDARTVAAHAIERDGDAREIIGMERGRVRGLARQRGLRRQREDRVELVAPRRFIGREVPFPGPVLGAEVKLVQRSSTHASYQNRSNAIIPQARTRSSRACSRSTVSSPSRKFALPSAHLFDAQSSPGSSFAMSQIFFALSQIESESVHVCVHVVARGATRHLRDVRSGSHRGAGSGSSEASPCSCGRSGVASSNSICCVLRRRSRCERHRSVVLRRARLRGARRAWPPRLRATSAVGRAPPTHPRRSRASAVAGIRGRHGGSQLQPQHFCFASRHDAFASMHLPCA